MSYLLLAKVLALVCAVLPALGTGNVQERIAFKGFPLGVNCGSVEVKSAKPNDNQTVQCVIMYGESVAFNESILWKNRVDEGSRDAEERFHNKIFSVILTWQNRSEIRNFTIKVKDPTFFNCSLESDDPVESNPLKFEVGDSDAISCFVRDLDTDISRKQYNDINAIWYHGCDEISPDNPEYSRTKGTYRKRIGPFYRTSFDGLKVLNTSLENTPGTYHCVLEYKGNRMFGASSNVCVKTEKTSSEQFEIRTDYTEIFLRPGHNLTISCFGNIYQEAYVFWDKYNESISDFDDYCMSYKEENGEMCTLDYPRPVCKKPIPGEPDRSIDNSFTAQLTMWNVSVSDNGLYRCLVQSNDKLREVNFTVTVTEQAKTSSKLTVILLVVAGVLLIAFLLLLLLYRFKQTEFHYVFKKLFVKTIHSDKPVTFLIYSEDAFIENSKNNTLRDVTDWMDSRGLCYHNPNDGKTLNNAGANIAVHNEEVIENCLSVTVILTPQLLEDNTMEIFNTYESFNESVKRNLPIVFICTKEMYRKIRHEAKVKNDRKDSEEKYSDRDINVTIRRFMKMNTVIIWTENDRGKFYRALYVALPKVKYYHTSHCNGMVSCDDEVQV